MSEGIPATSTAVYVSTPAAAGLAIGLGIRISTPAASLDVGGNAQFGNGITKSTFTYTGALNLASGAALTLAGSGGYITSRSSINASGFFGNGSQLTGISISLASTKTFNMAQVTGTQTSFNGCIAASSLTFTTNGVNFIEAEFYGTVGNGANDVNIYFLLDGKFINSQNTATTAECGIGTNGLGLTSVVSCRVRSDATQTAASHTLCMGLSTNSGTWTLYDGTAGTSQLYNKVMYREVSN